MTAGLGRSTIDVLTVGACAPVGLNVLEVATALRARRFEPSNVSFTLPVGAEDGDKGATSTRRLLMCHVDSVAHDCLGSARLLALGAPALREACHEIGQGPLPLMLALPERSRPGAGEDLPEDFLGALAKAAATPLDLRRSRTFREGHAGGASAFAAAIDLLERGEAEVAVVGGIDSYHQPATVDWLLREGLTRGPERFVPSEGAAFLVLARESPDTPRQPLARLCTAMVDRIEEEHLLALGDDAEARGSDSTALDPARARRRLGRALAAREQQQWKQHAPRKTKPRADAPSPSAAAGKVIAIMGSLLERLVKAWPGVPVEWVLSDVNNASSRVHEWQEVARRALPRDRVELRMVDHLGDLGAATGAMLAAMACTWWRIGCAPAPAALIALHSLLAERGLILLRRHAASSEAEGATEGAPADPRAAPGAMIDVTRAAASVWLDELGQLLLAIPDVGEDREGEAAAVALDAAMTAIQQIPSMALGDDRALSLLDEGLAQIDEARSRLPPAARLGQRLAAVRERMARRRPQLIEEAVRLPLSSGTTPTAAPASRPSTCEAERPFLSSRDTAALHHLEPTRLGAFVTRERRAQEVDESPRRAARRLAARQHLQAIARLSQTRRAGDLFPWSPSLRDFDEALLSQLDAFAALGNHGGADPDTIAPLDELAAFTAGARSDPDRAFVRAFVLGCQESRAAMQALVLALRQSDPATHANQAEALALASSPVIDEAMAQLCRDGDARMVRLALDVLAARRSVSFADVCPLLWHADPSIRRKAVVVLAYAHEQRDAAVGLLEPILYDELDDQTVAGAARSLLVLDVPRALDLVRQKLSDDVGQGDSLSRRARRQLLVLLAVGGAGSDLDLMLAAALPADADLLGWFGHVGAIEPLLALLQADATSTPRRRRPGQLEPPRQRAARALRRITGATPPATGLRHRRRPEALNSDPEFWRSWWKEHRGELDAAKRARWGKPYEPGHTIDELRTSGVAAHLRRLATTELSLLTVDAPPPWEGDWVGRQLRALDALRTLLQTKRTLAPGQWPATILGRRHRRPRR